MKEKMELRLAGSGGQGVILGAIILAEAALENDNYAVQSQSYGPEARGGMCKAEVIIGKDEIDFPKIENPDVLLALSQSSLDKYCNDTNENCMIIADSSLEIPNTKNKVMSVPIIETARNVIHNQQTANIVALGAINTLVPMVGYEALEKAVLKYVPSHAAEQNKKALQEGQRIAQSLILQ
ncbi:MAG: 2-oxoacid:acceptor oxidoreductase family protein [Clostridia bacterium]|nr:2-oxoacid:acceptor oxidoreductase family protein [Clostridia bacterium]